MSRSYAANSSLMATRTQDTFVFSTLSDLAMFYPFSVYANNISTVAYYFNNRIYKIFSKYFNLSGL